MSRMAVVTARPENESWLYNISSECFVLHCTADMSRHWGLHYWVYKLVQLGFRTTGFCNYFSTWVSHYRISH